MLGGFGNQEEPLCCSSEGGWGREAGERGKQKRDQRPAWAEGCGSQHHRTWLFLPEGCKVPEDSEQIAGGISGSLWLPLRMDLGGGGGTEGGRPRQVPA